MSAGTSLILVFGGIFTLVGAFILIMGCMGFIDCMPDGDFIICPFAATVDAGRYLCMASAMRLDHEKNCLLLIAVTHIAGGIKTQ